MTILFAIGLTLFYPTLPSLEVLTDYRPKVPLRVYASDGSLIGEFGEERRSVIKMREVPEIMKQAIMAAEDERFYQHSGVDFLGVGRATLANLVSGGKRQGASTITMQVARNFFLSSEKTLKRKIYEILLSFKIENNLSKDQIFELYINQIFLGQRAYGFASASQIYFGKPIGELSIAEAAMLAGLPKAPSAFNPVVNPKRAKLRQQYVLRRMRELGFITQAQYDAANAQELQVKNNPNSFSGHAEFAAEMARQIAMARFPDDAYTRGLRIYTTINLEEQEAAYQSLRTSVMNYDKRHGYRGAEDYVDMGEVSSDQDESMDVMLQDVTDAGDLIPAIVLAADSRQIKAYRRGGEVITLTGEAMRLASRWLDDKTPANKRIRRGAIIRLIKGNNGWQLTQLPEIESAFLAANPADGAVRALIGGFDFSRNQFNHVTQAWRQPGSSFKPFIYSAAVEKGFGPGSVIPDDPITITSAQTGSKPWSPHNYDNRYEGPMKMRSALAKSKNMVSIRLLQAVGVTETQEYTTRFGFDSAKIGPYLTMALGAVSVTPWQMVRAYSVFANGGYRVEPYIVREIRDDRGNLLAQFNPPTAGDESTRVIDARNAYLMDQMMRDVTSRGTAARAAAELARKDTAGKTGTTNDYVDAWFCGYQKTVAACAWIGFDQPRKMGNGETGGTAALPTWIGYMKQALKGVPETFMPEPEGLKSAGGEQYYNDYIASIGGGGGTKKAAADAGGEGEGGDAANEGETPAAAKEKPAASTEKPAAAPAPAPAPAAAGGE